MEKRQLERQIERTKRHIEDYEARKDSLSFHGYWALGYYQGKLTAMEDSLDDIEAAELVSAQVIAEKIFADIEGIIVESSNNSGVLWTTQEALDIIKKKYNVEVK